ncbi:hypothetical protein [Corynebacterium sp. sy039]|uniref:hypothetical protein n=1 Tax=Corynebacterium sp. sy039 TaxID=2599641 RepID=UPI0011B7BA60|nr:hypothetical protein [Corynebacterium sp. sy039]QDZ42857.1 hypothetical protein FQV43_06540 [Corynebacterium sp. sy039]
MPVIHFDCLCAPEHVESIKKQLDKLNELIIRDKKVESVVVNAAENTAIDHMIEQELRRVFIRERSDGSDSSDDVQDTAGELHKIAENRRIYRFSIHLSGVVGSINALTMLYARIFTPAAQLPNDRIQLEQENQLEQAALFPWTVTIEP